MSRTQPPIGNPTQQRELFNFTAFTLKRMTETYEGPVVTIRPVTPINRGSCLSGMGLGPIVDDIFLFHRQNRRQETTGDGLTVMAGELPVLKAVM